MKLQSLTTACVPFFMLSCASTAKAPAAPATAEAPVAPFIQNMRQITFEGKRAGEGYFSHDGRYMVFQSEREPGNPFYQIYVTDLKTGETHRVSPGEGKTSCAWIAPDNKRILFASTHLDPDLKKKADIEYEERKNPKRYSWNFDPAFDIFVSDFNGRHLKNLTHTMGYDAEGSFSPNGKLIAFASNRAAYTEKMTDEQKKLFAQDPSSMMDIYIMNSDGSNVKRLTTNLGYDGGPFFSPDGKRLTFRRFTIDGRKAEVYTMNIDGSDQKQITHLGVMSWAPFYHPSGQYLIFASNKLGFQNFELFIVDVEGKHDPVRVTDLPGFDGLPVFTPDGHSLVWTHTNSKGESQLHRAEWNDDLARKALDLPPAEPVAGADAQAWIEYLASNKLGGRPTGSAEEREYMNTLAQAFSEMGLKPIGPSFLHEYEFTAGVDMGAKNTAHLETKKIENELTAGRDWIPFSFSQTGEAAKASMIFVGYGIVAPASGTQAAYDAYSGVDVKGKWVVVFTGLPNDVSNERRYFLNSYAHVQYKAMMARQRGAAGVIVIEDSTVTSPTNMNLVYEGRTDGAGIPVVRLSSSLAAAMFHSAGTSLEAWTKRLGTGEPGNLDIPNAQFSVTIDLKLRKGKALNLIGELASPHAHESIMIGAHGDHLGRGEQGHSLSPDSHAIHPGADDNASGVAGVMLIAHDVTANPKPGLKQNLIFAVWTGEELGDLGSTAFMNSKPPKISAYLNMDMIGRYRDQLVVQGLGSAPEWKTLVEEVNVAHPLSVHTQDDPYLPTDSLSFYLKKVPTLSFFTGSHPQYHSPSDTPDLINAAGVKSIAGWVEAMALKLASTASSQVHYQKVDSIQQPVTGNRSFRLYLGTIPDYSQETKTGVVISGTRKDSPAEKAGLRAGDTILELGGMKIKNLYDYMYCLQALKANERIAMRIQRAGEEKTLQITPLLKQP